MLIESELLKTYWAEAMATAVHIIAQSPATGLKGDTPFEKMFGRRIDPSIFHPFGCCAYALIPKDKRTGKFGPKGRPCVLLGYKSEKKAYRLLDLNTRKVILS
jgi:hypothetical protein